jgi:DNA-binding MarR family transcriptional regulator
MAARSSSARRFNEKVQHEGSPRKVSTSAAPEIATTLDRLLHDRMRLGIVSALAAGGEMSFTDLKDSLNATDGNLSVHARKLEDAQYIACEKTDDARAQTEYRLTGAGRRAFEKYLSHMEAIIKAVR